MKKINVQCPKCGANLEIEPVAVAIPAIAVSFPAKDVNKAESKIEPSVMPAWMFPICFLSVVKTAIMKSAGWLMVGSLSCRMMTLYSQSLRRTAQFLTVVCFVAGSWLRSFTCLLKQTIRATFPLVLLPLFEERVQIPVDYGS